MKSSGSTSIQNSFRFIQAGVALLLIFLVAEGWILWRVCNQGTAATRVLQDEGLPSLQCLASLQENLAIYRLKSYELMFAQEQDRPAKSRDADAVQQKNIEIIAALDKLFPQGEGHQHVTSLQASLTDYVQAMSRVRVMLDKDFAAAMKMLDQEIPSRVQRLNEEAGQVKVFCTKAAADRATMTVDSFSRIRNFVLWLGSVNILFSAFTVGMVAFNSVRVRRALNALVESLTFISESLVGSAGMVASSSQSLAQGSSTQAASIEETSASLEELSSMTKQNADNTQKANELARQAREAADRGSADMQQMKLAMEEIKTSSDDVSKIIKTIDEIAFQTNILALNAAVEAARAGDAGMGFAVVADEVRNLAQRSANAAKETTAKIEGAISKTSQGVEISGKVEQTLNDIVGKARLLDELAAGVATASREQTQGITQIGAAVGSMDSVTQTNAASAEASASAAEQLNSQARALKDAVVELQRLVGGRISGAAANENGKAPAPERAHFASSKAPKKRATALTSKNASIGDLPMPGDSAQPRQFSVGTPSKGDFQDF